MTGPGRTPPARRGGPRRFITRQDVDGLIAAGAPLVLDETVTITDAALDHAREQGLEIVRTSHEPRAGGPDREAPAPSRPVPTPRTAPVGGNRALPPAPAPAAPSPRGSRPGEAGTARSWSLHAPSAPAAPPGGPGTGPRGPATSGVPAASRPERAVWSPASPRSAPGAAPPRSPRSARTAVGGGPTRSPAFDRYPEIRLDYDNIDFYEGLLERRYLLNRCQPCGHWHTPPRSTCPRCWSNDVVPTEISGRGTLHLLTYLHQGPPAPGVDYSTPYPLIGVQLVEQDLLRISSTLVDCPRDEVRLDMALELTWIERAGNPFPAFRPAQRQP